MVVQGVTLFDAGTTADYFQHLCVPAFARVSMPVSTRPRREPGRLECILARYGFRKTTRAEVCRARAA